MDDMIGRILDKLEATGLDENTLVIYCSDHGDQLGERGLWWKQTFYDESVKIPLIMAWPGVLPAGEVRTQVVNLTDLAATIWRPAQPPHCQTVTAAVSWRSPGIPPGFGSTRPTRNTARTAWPRGPDRFRFSSA